MFCQYKAWLETFLNYSRSYVLNDSSARNFSIALLKWHVCLLVTKGFQTENNFQICQNWSELNWTKMSLQCKCFPHTRITVNNLEPYKAHVILMVFHVIITVNPNKNQEFIRKDWRIELLYYANLIRAIIICKLNKSLLESSESVGIHSQKSLYSLKNICI